MFTGLATQNAANEMNLTARDFQRHLCFIAKTDSLNRSNVSRTKVAEVNRDTVVQDGIKTIDEDTALATYLFTCQCFILCRSERLVDRN